MGVLVSPDEDQELIGIYFKISWKGHHDSAFVVLRSGPIQGSLYRKSMATKDADTEPVAPGHEGQMWTTQISLGDYYCLSSVSPCRWAPEVIRQGWRCFYSTEVPDQSHQALPVFAANKGPKLRTACLILYSWADHRIFRRGKQRRTRWPSGLTCTTALTEFTSKRLACPTVVPCYSRWVNIQSYNLPFCHLEPFCIWWRVAFVLLGGLFKAIGLFA